MGLAIPVLTTTFVEQIVPIGLQALTESLMDWRLLAFAGVLCRSRPVSCSAWVRRFDQSHASTADVLQQHARSNTGGRSRAFRDGLVVLQVAATLVLLVAAGLMLRTLANLNGVERGFDANNLLTMQRCRPCRSMRTRSKVRSSTRRIVAGVRVLPGVRGAAFGSMLPFQSAGNTRTFTVEGVQPLPGDLPDALFRVGTGDYLRTLRRDPRRGTPPRCARRRRCASRHLSSTKRSSAGSWTGDPRSASSIRFDPAEPPFTVVGVVRDVLERGYEQDSKPGVYVAQVPGPRFFPTVNLVVRVDGNPLNACVGSPTRHSGRRTGAANPSGPADDGGHQSHRCRSPPADDTVGLVRRSGTRDRVAWPVRPPARTVDQARGMRSACRWRARRGGRDADGAVRGLVWPRCRRGDEAPPWRGRSRAPWARCSMVSARPIR